VDFFSSLLGLLSTIGGETETLSHWMQIGISVFGIGSGIADMILEDEDVAEGYRIREELRRAQTAIIADLHHKISRYRELNCDSECDWNNLEGWEDFMDEVAGERNPPVIQPAP